MSEQPEHIQIETTPPNQRNLEEFRRLYPGLLQDGVLDAAGLGAALGVEVTGLQDGKERFGLMWAGKHKAIEALQAPSYAALAPDLENSINWDTAENVFIEGDNLEVLKLLQNAYNDQVKLIYIDPPYNTGKDFVYNDDFSDPKQHYLEVTGQVDAAGNRLVANTEVSGRKHSNWLTMMYPRLVLARNLLTEDGSIFISIDDNELHNLRAILDEIFGPENFVTIFPWQSRPSVQNDTDISSSHEYIVCYARNRRMVNRRLKAVNAKTWFDEPSFVVQPLATNPERYKLDDGDGRGKYKEDPFDAPGIRPNLTFDIVNPNTGKVHLPPAGRHWRTSEPEYLRLWEDSRISWGASGASGPKQKTYYAEKAAYGEVPSTWLSAELVGAATNGSKELQALFGGEAPFDTPKPTTLIRKILQLAMRDDGIVLDFFAGSGTTGHAVLLENLEKSKKIKFVLVNIDEATGEGSTAKRLGYQKVSDVTKKRLSLAARACGASEAGNYLLTGSSFHEHQLAQNDELFGLREKTLQPDSISEKVAAELFLKMGIRFGNKIARHAIVGGEVFLSSGVAVVICVNLPETIVSGITDLQPHTVVFLEDAFVGKDSLKANAFFALKNAGIVMKTV